MIPAIKLAQRLVTEEELKLSQGSISSKTENFKNSLLISMTISFLRRQRKQLGGLNILDMTFTNREKLVCKSYKKIKIKYQEVLSCQRWTLEVEFEL